jgi:hypothetical protein
MTTTMKKELTAEQKREKYACALDDMQQDTKERSERLKAQFRDMTVTYGYGYVAQWHLEEVVTAEHLATYMTIPVNLLKLLVEGTRTVQEVRAELEKYRGELQNDLLRCPWEHHCTDALVNVMALWAATAKARAIEMINSYLRHALPE